MILFSENLQRISSLLKIKNILLLTVVIVIITTSSCLSEELKWDEPPQSKQNLEERTRFLAFRLKAYKKGKGKLPKRVLDSQEKLYECAKQS